MEALLQVIDYSITFNQKFDKDGMQSEGVTAVRGLSYQINRGECLAIVGESGCGKSAGLQGVLALHDKGASTSGEIFFKEHALHEFSSIQMEQVRGKKIAVVFQDPMSALNPTMKIGLQISEALTKKNKLTKAAKKKAVIQLLTEVGITDPEIRYQQYPFEFSGGMLQRVAIAMALAGKPELIMADEPTTALDATVQKQVLTLIKNIQTKNNMALIIVSHDLAVVYEMADRVLVMYAGEMVEQGDVDKVFTAPLHPYTQALLRSLPKMGEKREKLPTIEGRPPDLSLPIHACAFVDRCSKAMNICDQEKPPLILKEKREVRCWLYHERAPKLQGH